MRDRDDDYATISVKKHDTCPHGNICHTMLKVNLKGQIFKLTKKGILSVWSGQWKSQTVIFQMCKEQN